ncbi:MAG TPA: flippase [Oscillospiraceae bacterium]|nr:flippase [Oscillospiraceae bacterium]
MRKNYIYHIIYQLSICVLPLVVTPYVARVLGVENNGIYAFSSTVACYFIMLGKLGLDNYGNRSIAFVRDNRKERSRIFWSIYALQLMTSILALFFYIGVVTTFFQEYFLIYLMQLIYVISMIFDVSWFFYGMEKFHLTTVRSLISRALLIIGIFLFVSTKNDLWIFTGLMSAGFLIEQFLLFPFIFRYVDFVSIKWEDIARHLKPNLQLFIPVLALSIYNWMDKLMLGLIDGAASVAYYNYAESIINLPKGIVTALGTVMLPTLSYMVAVGAIHTYQDVLERSMGIVSFIACALCFGIAGVAPVFVSWFLGPGYNQTAILTMELAIVMIPMSIVDVIQTQYLIPFQHESIYIRSVVLGALVNLGLNTLLIPHWGASGAVIGTIGAGVAVCVYQLVHIRRVLSPKRLVKILVPFIICGIFEFVAIYILRDLKIRSTMLLLLQIGVGGGLYLLGCLGYILLFRPEWADIQGRQKEVKNS